MKEYLNYLKTLDINERSPIFKRLSLLYNIGKRICPDKISDIFISEYMNAGGSRQYVSFWLFSENYVLESPQFLKETNMDIIPIKNAVNYCQFNLKDYELVKSTKDSRFTLLAYFAENAFGEFKASGENCNKLLLIFEKYFKGNME